MSGYIEKLAQLAQQGAPFVAVTVVDAFGSTPQDVGSKMLVDHQGLCYGTVGGGRIEQQAIGHAQQMLQRPPTSAPTHLVRWNLKRDVGMTCGGVVQLYFEAVNHQVWDIVLFGAGHVAGAVVRCLLALDCRITCWDSRQPWLSRMPSSPRLTTCCEADLASCVSQIPAGAFVLLMTMGHRTDGPVLETILNTDHDFPYVGVIGSRAKRAVLRREMIESGLPPERADQFRCPIGLPLGSNEPGEIAISVVAELLQVRDAVRDADDTTME